MANNNSGNSNQLLVPGVQQALDQMKNEIASEFGVQPWTRLHIACQRIRRRRNYKAISASSPITNERLPTITSV